jgi:hypothetical protein
MKKTLQALVLLGLALGAKAQSTFKLDSTFNGNGIFSTNGTAGNNAEAYAIGGILNNDGSVWLAGQLTGAGNSSRTHYIARRKANGTADSAFCNSGGAGWTYTNWNTMGYLLGLHPVKNGGVYAPHTGWGGYHAASPTTTTVTKEVYDEFDANTIRASAKLNDSVIVELGETHGLFTYKGLNSNTYQGFNWFNNNSIHYGTIPVYSYINTTTVKLRNVATQSNEKILVYGYADSANYPKPFIMRLKKNSFSEPDSTFGVNGISYVPQNVFGLSEITAHYVQNDDKIILHNGQYFMRLNADGSYDAGFGYFQRNYPDNGGLPTSAKKFVTNSTNTELYGICNNFSGDNTVFALTINGQSLNSFHNGKDYFRKLDNDINFNFLELNDISINSDGDLLVCGKGIKNSGGVYELFAMKLKRGTCAPISISVVQSSNTAATLTISGSGAYPFEIYYLIEDPGTTISSNSTTISTTPGTTYTITVIDDNGCVGTTVYTANPLSISNNHATQFAIYPNPATTALNFDLPQLSKQATYNIVSIEGKLVQQSKLTNKTIDIANLQAGIYFVNIKDEQHNYSAKFVKE